MKEREVKILDMSTVLRPLEAFALVLEEQGGKFRRLALIIGGIEAHCIRMARADYKTPRPLTHDLIVALGAGGRLTFEKAVIYEVNEGIYSSYLYIRREDGKRFRVDCRTTDAIVLSLKCGFRIYALEDLLEHEQLRHISPEGNSYNVSVNAVDTRTLRRAFEAAVRAEDYERAAELRDELERRARKK